MDELWDAEGKPVAATIEWVESSGPVSPRFQYTTRLLLKVEQGRVCISHERKDSSGIATQEGTLSRDRYEALWRALLGILPLGTHLDLSSHLQGRKGISFNHVALSLGEGTARLDYVLSQLDESEGDPRVRGVVEALRTAAGEALGEG